MKKVGSFWAAQIAIARQEGNTCPPPLPSESTWFIYTKHEILNLWTLSFHGHLNLFGKHQVRVILTCQGQSSRFWHNWSSEQVWGYQLRLQCMGPRSGLFTGPNNKNNNNLIVLATRRLTIIENSILVEHFYKNNKLKYFSSTERKTLFNNLLLIYFYFLVAHRVSRLLLVAVT